MRVLVAGATATNNKVLAGLLMQLGFETQIVTDGEQALAELLKPNTVRVAILDWEMPLVDGVEVCRRVRSTDGLAQPLIIIATSRDGNKAVAEVLKAGADELIRKPIDSGELAARMRSAQRTVDLQNKVQELQAALQVVGAFGNLAHRQPHRETQAKVSGTLSSASGGLQDIAAHLEELLKGLAIVDADLTAGTDIWSHAAIALPLQGRWFDVVLSCSRPMGRKLFQKVTTQPARQDSDLLSVASDILNLLLRPFRDRWAEAKTEYFEPAGVMSGLGQPPSPGEALGHYRVELAGIALEVIETHAERRQTTTAALSPGDVLLQPLLMPSQPGVALLPANTLVKAAYLRRVSALLQTAAVQPSLWVVTASALTQLTRECGAGTPSGPPSPATAATMQKTGTR